MQKRLKMQILGYPRWVAALSEGYPPHDTGVDEGEAEISNQGDRAVETLQDEDESQSLDERLHQTGSYEA